MKNEQIKLTVIRLICDKHVAHCRFCFQTGGDERFVFDNMFSCRSRRKRQWLTEQMQLNDVPICVVQMFEPNLVQAEILGISTGEFRRFWFVTIHSAEARAARQVRAP